MKQFKPYRDIRKKAIIFGLPLNLFALQMLSVIGSLMVIIFSFGMLTILTAIAWNCLLFIGLNRFSKQPHLGFLKKSFPKRISNKRQSTLDYE